MSKKSNQCSPEVRDRAVPTVREHRGEYLSPWAAIESIAPKIGCVPQTLNEWVKRDQIDTGVRDGITTSEREQMKALEREVKELRARPVYPAQQLARQASALTGACDDLTVDFTVMGSSCQGLKGARRSGTTRLSRSRLQPTTVPNRTAYGSQLSATVARKAHAAGARASGGRRGRSRHAP